MATTTPNYGWDVPTSTDYVKDGATAIETLGDDIDATLYTALGGAYPGLRLVKKQTIGTAVSSISVTDAFSATYPNYVIFVTGGTSTADTYLNLALTGGANSYDYNLIYTTWTSATVIGDRAQNSATLAYGGSCNLTNGLDLNITVKAPFLTQYTYFQNQINTSAVGGNVICRHKSATSFTGFTIGVQTGTVTGGTIYVYGYGAS
jgi:hypothetical protein